jgi:hypothetical protein
MVMGNVETMEKLVRHTCLSHTLIKSIDLLTQYSTITIHHSDYKIHHSDYKIHHSDYKIHHSDYKIHHSDYKIHHSDYKNRLMNSQFVCLVLKGGK